MSYRNITGKCGKIKYEAEVKANGEER